jgi:hypothetical protein
VHAKQKQLVNTEYLTCYFGMFPRKANRQKAMKIQTLALFDSFCYAFIFKRNEILPLKVSRSERHILCKYSAFLQGCIVLQTP